jgi:hypothetical protein
MTRPKFFEVTSAGLGATAPAGLEAVDSRELVGDDRG